MTKKTIDSLINGNCIPIMKGMDKDSINLIIADPPFGIKQNKNNGAYNRNKDLVIDGYVEVNNDKYDEFSDKWIFQAARVLAPSGSMYVLSGWNHLEEILRALRQNNLHMINHIIWQYSFGLYAKKKYITSHYHLLFVVKNPKSYTFNREYRWKDDEKEDGRSLNYSDRQDVWNINRENWAGKVKTRNKLPRNLVEKMIGYSSNPGDLILDSFMGSGQIPFIAKQMARRYIGIEISTNIFNFGKYRIESNDYYGKEFKL
jgi:site-specific DNA-methyltransferase (adenine-specific)